MAFVHAYVPEYDYALYTKLRNHHLVTPHKSTDQAAWPFWDFDREDITPEVTEEPQSLYEGWVIK